MLSSSNQTDHTAAAIVYMLAVASFVTEKKKNGFSAASYSSEDVDCSGHIEISWKMLQTVAFQNGPVGLPTNSHNPAAWQH